MFPPIPFFSAIFYLRHPMSEIPHRTWLFLHLWNCFAKNHSALQIQTALNVILLIQLTVGYSSPLMLASIIDCFCYYSDFSVLEGYFEETLLHRRNILFGCSSP